MSEINDYNLDNDLKLPDCKLCNSIIDFSKNMNYIIQVHSNKNGKSRITEIENEKTGEQYLTYLSRQASLGTRQLWTNFNDIEDINLKNKFEILEESTEKEIDRIKKLDKKAKNSNHKKLLTRFKRFFKFRKKLMGYREENKISSKNVEKIIGLMDITQNQKNELDNKKINDFFNYYDEDIFLVEYLFYLRNLKNIYKADEESKNDVNKKESNIVKSYYKKIKEATKKFDKAVYGDNYKEVSYFYNICNDFDINQSKYKQIDKYKSIKKRVDELLPQFNNIHFDKKMESIEKINNFFMNDNKKMDMYYYLEYLKRNTYFNEKNNNSDLIMNSNAFKWVIKNTSKLYRMILNAIFSKVFNVVLNDKFQIGKLGHKPLSYSEFKILVYLRNINFEVNDFFDYINSINIGNSATIDYTLFEVIDYYNKFVKKPKLIDNLIEIHRYTSSIWKNGSKFLHFYTLHNEEHGVNLIKNAIKFIKSVDYFKIKKLDYYVLFISCYLHDISMVTHPDLKEVFTKNNKNSNLLYSEFKEDIKNKIQDRQNELFQIDIIPSKEVKDLLVKYYSKLDGFFENHIRNEHPKDSANSIRNSSDLNFISNSIRELVASVSEAHGYDVADIYNIKSEAKNSLISMKYAKIALRMADLLDISKDRISTVILKNNIDYMSDKTKFHWISHKLIEKYEIKTKYTNKKIKKNNYFDASYIKPGVIDENIIFIIYVNSKQLTKTQSNNCDYAYLNNLNRHNENKQNHNSNLLEISISKTPKSTSGKCKGKCNFLCKWLAKKNNYLYKELHALNNYLEKNPNNYFSTKITVQIKYTGKNILKSEYIDILNDFINN